MTQPARLAPRNQRSSFYVVLCAVITVALILAPRLWADTLSGTVKDPSGAVVAKAKIVISGGTLTAPLELKSDADGKFSAPSLAPGKYVVHVAKDGFDEFSTTVDLAGTADVTASLTISSKQTALSVTEKNTAMANSDPVYRGLRDSGLGESYQYENFTLPMDVGTFVFRKGVITLLAPVNGFITGAVFCGRRAFLAGAGGRDG